MGSLLEGAGGGNEGREVGENRGEVNLAGLPED